MAPARPIPPPSPEALVAQWREQGDPEALGALFDATAPALFRIAMSLTRDAVTAEEVLQETYLEAMECLDRYDATRPVTPWLVGILKMAVRRAHRAGARKPDPVRVADSRPVEGAAGDVGDGEEARQVRDAIDELEEPYRSVALLRWRYGLEPAEIADVRGEPPGTVRSLLSRALAQMKGRLRGSAAMLLLAPLPLGLDAVRRVVMERARTLVPTGGVAASIAAAASGSVWRVVLLSAASVGALAVGVATWSARHEERPRAASASPPIEAPTPAAELPAPEEPKERAPEPPARLRPAPPDDRNPPTETPVPPQASAPLPKPPRREPTVSPAEPATSEPEEPTPTEVASKPPPPPPPPAISGAPASMPLEGAALPPPNSEVPTPDDVAAIDKAIAAGIEALAGRQRSDGSWGSGLRGSAAYGGGPAPEESSMPAGPTALALYALLKSGAPADSAVIVRGFKYLERFKSPGTAYEASAMLLAVTATAEKLPDAEAKGKGVRLRLSGAMRARAERLHDDLVAAQHKSGGWRYALRRGAPPTAGGPADLSSTQLAALALLEATRCGIATAPSVWRDMIEFAQSQQETDGPARERAVDEQRGSAGPKAGARPMDRARGFAYVRDPSLDPDEGQATGSMTACGVAILESARFALSLAKAPLGKRPADAETLQQSIRDGLAWLDLHWSPYENPGKTKINVYHLYWLYSIERAMDLLGVHRLGTHFWYVEMARQLVARQKDSGIWDSNTTHEPQDVLDTSFALLFLRRATTEIIRNPSVTGGSDEPPTDQRGK